MVFLMTCSFVFGAWIWCAEKEKWRALSPLLPNPYVYLPHLRDHPDSLTPNVLLGQGRRRGEWMDEQMNG